MEELKQHIQSRQSTPVFMPGEFHGQRGPGRLQSMGSRESDTTERLTHNSYQEYEKIVFSICAAEASTEKIVFKKIIKIQL